MNISKICEKCNGAIPENGIVSYRGRPPHVCCCGGVFRVPEAPDKSDIYQSGFSAGVEWAIKNRHRLKE